MKHVFETFLRKYYHDEECKRLGAFQGEKRIPIIAFNKVSATGGMSAIEYFEFYDGKIFFMSIPFSKKKEEETKKEEVDTSEILDRISLHTLPNVLYSNEEGIRKLEKIMEGYLKEEVTNDRLQIIKAILSCSDFIALKEVKSILK